MTPSIRETTLRDESYNRVEMLVWSGKTRKSGGGARGVAMAMMFGAAPFVVGCADPEYDASTPDLAIDAMQRMVEDGRADRLVTLVHIEPRDISYADGVSEESAIADVLDKAGELLARIWRVSRKLNERFPGEAVAEAGAAGAEFGALLGAGFERGVSEFLTDPFAFITRQRDRITAIDMGDDTAAILWDGQPPFGGIGLGMVETGGTWKIDIPIDAPMLREYRPDTREEWGVIANIMLGLENALQDFESRLDRGEFSSLADAGNQAGRMLGESAIVQGLIYRTMKENRDGE
jgi:hypothetical protein